MERIAIMVVIRKHQYFLSFILYKVFFEYVVRRMCTRLQLELNQNKKKHTISIYTLNGIPYQYKGVR